jgi:hypothetical protein
VQRFFFLSLAFPPKHWPPAISLRGHFWWWLWLEVA